MAIIRCVMGHFYDNKKDWECPVCRQIKNGSYDSQADHLRNQVTVPRFHLPGGKDQVQTIFMDGYEGNGADPERTIGIFSKLKGNDFVTGWLVCVSGPEKGRDYRLYHGFNLLGRRTDMDIYVGEDPEISGEGHCGVVYDGKSNQFLLTALKGNLVYKGGEMIRSAVKLESGDRFVVGGSEFELIAFCREGHTWEDG